MHVANREKGEFSITAGERTLTFRLTTNACAEVEDLANGRTWQQIQVGVARGSLKDFCLLFWAALREHHADIATDDPASIKAIGKLIDEAGGIVGLQTQIEAFLALNEQPAELKDDGAGKKAAPADPLPAQATDSGDESISTLAASA